jgi:hypothetical protein
MGSKVGTMKVAATRIGISYEEYVALVGSGLKRCSKCKTWRPLDDFNKDASRGSGYNASCRACRSTRTTPGPTIYERRKQREKGVNWCSGCLAWLPVAEVKQGKCRKHHAEYERNRYSKDKSYRQERRQHAHSRKRNVALLPPEAQDMLMEEFGGKCAYCGDLATTWDHIEPVSEGGDTTPGNIVPACVSCNSSKKCNDVIEWLDKNGLGCSCLLFEKMCLAKCGFYG